MALKPDREYVLTDISTFMSATAERGGIVSLSSATASGVALDQAGMSVAYTSTLSGVKPYGLLLNDVVNKDLTQTHLNFYKDEVQINSKVAVLKNGWVVTDMIYPGHTPVAGGKAYVGHSGYIAASNVATDHADTTGADKVIGRFETVKNEDGFCRVRVNL